MDQQSKIEKEYEYVRKVAKYYEALITSIQKDLQPVQIELERQHIDSIKSMATISGALAALSLTIFSSGVKRIDLFLIIGVVLLLFNVLIAFRYWLRRTTKSYLAVTKAEQMILPLHQRVQDAKDYVLKKLSYTDFMTRQQQMNRLIAETRFSSKEEGMNYVDEVILVVLALAIGFIVLSLALPLFPPFTERFA